MFTLRMTNLVVECRVTKFLPEGVQSLLNYLLPVQYGKLSQGKQDSASFLGQGLQQCCFGCDAHYQTNTLTKKLEL